MAKIQPGRHAENINKRNTQAAERTKEWFCKPTDHVELV